MLYQCIKTIYPSIKDIDFSLQDDGAGAYIKDWTYAQPRPTKKQIADALPSIQLREVTAQFEYAIQSYLDSKAQSSNYDDILSACSYASAPNPFQNEGIQFVKWRGNVWVYCYGELDKVKTGKREMPTVEQIISELPPL